MQWLSSLRDALAKTRNGLAGHFNALLGRQLVDDTFWSELEETLISADFGVSTTEKIIAQLKLAAQQQNLRAAGDVVRVFRSDVADYLTHPKLAPVPARTKPHVVLVVGRERLGQDHHDRQAGAAPERARAPVLLVAGDTFRAAAAEQLAIWAERAGAEFVSRHAEGADAARRWSSTAYEAAKAAGYDVVLIDTAGRLQTKQQANGRAQEDRRVHRARGRPDAPHETLLVLDATTGQNALSQAKLFHEAADVTGIVMTKLDGTAKGGIIVAIMDQADLPVKYVGFGEQVDQLKAFDPASYVDALF